MEKGTIISEFPIGTKPEASNFPKRNRIISGLSHATIVVEVGNKSGAIPVQNDDQVLQYIENRLFNQLAPTQQKIILDLTNEDQSVFKNLSHDPIHIDLLSEKTGIGVTSLLGILLSLELKGAIIQIGGRQFIVS